MKIVALAGGVGGAKLVDGLAQILLPKDLTIVVNTGDDFEHLVVAIMDPSFKFSYEWNTADEVFKFWTAEGSRFLDGIRDCNTEDVVSRFKKPLRNDGALCLENLKSMEPGWRNFVDQDGSLEIWVDG